MSDPMIHLTLAQMEGIIKAGKLQKVPSTFERFLLRGLKIPGDDVKTFAKMFELAQSIMGVVSTVGAALSTVKGLLELTGLLKTVDPFAEVKALFEARFQELKDFLQDEEQEQQIDLRSGWQVKVEDARVALGNLNSRTEFTLSAATVALSALGGALSDMLDAAQLDTGNGLEEYLPARGWITFAWGAYSYPPPVYDLPPQHWVPYARPEFMALAASPRPVQYCNQNDNLKQRIWDPSFYLDVMMEGLSVYVALLTAIEPAFRATRYERDRIRLLSQKLAIFIATWRARLIRTKVDPFLPAAQSTDDKTHLWHPFGNPYLPSYARGIPMGVIDPVSGMAAFEAVYNEGFDFNDGIFSPDRRQVLNATSARMGTEAAIQSLLSAMPDVCGIKALEVTKAQFDALADYGLYGSMFTRFEPMPMAYGKPGSLTAAGAYLLPALPVGDEQISLGEIGVRAGKPGKFYTAKRYVNTSSYPYRVSMARRMDVTKIQLGYRLRISIEGSSVVKEIELCKYDESGSIGESAALKIFPDQVHEFDLVADDAWLYDIVQSRVLGKADEARLAVGQPVPDFERLFLNRRKGSVRARVKIWPTFDAENNDAPILGHANFVVTNLDDTPDGAFHLTFSIVETASIAYGSYLADFATDGVGDIPAGSMDLHVIPSYLVAEADYFSDRIAGLLVFDRSLLDVVQTLDMVPKPWEDDGQPPVWQMKEVAFRQERVVQAYDALMRTHPQALEAATRIFEVPRQRER